MAEVREVNLENKEVPKTDSFNLSEEMNKEVERRVQERLAKGRAPCMMGTIHGDSTHQLKQLKDDWEKVCAVFYFLFGNIGYAILFFLRVACMTYVLCGASALYRKNTGMSIWNQNDDGAFFIIWHVLEVVLHVLIRCVMSKEDKSDVVTRKIFLSKDASMFAISAMFATLYLCCNVRYDFGLIALKVFIVFSFVHVVVLFCILGCCIADMMHKPENRLKWERVQKAYKSYIHYAFNTFF